ncbi:PSD1 and planctomycete cytochrome C domain-containing protein [Verrucomicrobium sp. BvORR106]|uniref:PSD1 and planctomycete cytochrome C domain-containing protein n=1 Tax=Verrucomicrobium sp. BvORR106 TaxID=1403819 RepID=UPI00056EC3D3|nr:PSD1 and planctomycete cytochrome C domain-containing protein [Verrucomicrobium sp. BvORR106]
MISRIQIWGLLPMALLLSQSLVHAAAEVDFARDVQPILQRHCLKCHGPDESNGGLRYDHKQGAFAQADSGAHAIVPGKVEESALLKRVSSTHKDEQMPPKGERLTSQEVEVLRTWISAGATWPDSPAAADPAKVAASKHWSFQPLSNPSVPEVKDQSWPRTPLDRFLQSRREGAGLEASPDADARTLIRRATYDLTGLPPTAAEVEYFVQAFSRPEGKEAAMAALVDRLLESPRYGERWGRHWMDWVRYADTAGDNSDYPVPQAYLYRQYIIDSLNSDVPYNRFITEQIAGDLLPAGNQEERNRLNIATGYLAMARRFGSLVERYPWHLTIEDTIDNMGRTMLGLTLSCARCHDHKFDPVSTRDYYGLYGIFASTRYPFPGLELFKAQRDFVPLIPELEAAESMAPYQEEADRLRAEMETLLDRCEKMKIENAALEKERTLQEQRRKKGELDGLLFQARKAGEAFADYLKQLPVLPAAYAVQDGKPQNARIQIKGEPDRLGAEVPRKFLEILGGAALPEETQAGSGRLQLAQWVTDERNPLTARVIVNRIWQRHFGTGLVPSTSDFGLRGEAPTHPELLDWLAAEFMRSGWSMKQLHRLIMTSRAYQLSSQDTEDNVGSDPGNRLYWKFGRQRLDAESLRDTLLFVSGGLDLAPQTQPYAMPPTSNWDFTQHHPFKGDYPNSKRSVYQMTKRLTAKPYLQTFDGADPNVCTSTRDRSVTALQALFFVNDKFVHEQADRLAKALLEEKSGSEETRLRQLYTSLFAREPDETEAQMLQDHLVSVRQALGDSEQAETKAWSSLLRSLFRLNEFLYLD